MRHFLFPDCRASWVVLWQFNYSVRVTAGKSQREGAGDGADPGRKQASTGPVEPRMERTLGAFTWGDRSAGSFRIPSCGFWISAGGLRFHQLPGLCFLNVAVLIAMPVFSGRHYSFLVSRLVCFSPRL